MIEIWINNEDNLHLQHEYINKTDETRRRQEQELIWTLRKC